MENFPSQPLIETDIGKDSVKSGNKYQMNYDDTKNKDTISQFISKCERFIELERLEDCKEELILESANRNRKSFKILKKKGLALSGLRISHIDIGFYGKYFVTCTMPSSFVVSAQFKISRGDDVRIMFYYRKLQNNTLYQLFKCSPLQSDKDLPTLQGIVYNITNNKIIILMHNLSSNHNDMPSFKDDPIVKTDLIKFKDDVDLLPADFIGLTVSLVKASSGSIFKRVESSLKKLNELFFQNGLSNGMKAILNLMEPDIQAIKNIELEEWDQEKENEEEKEDISRMRQTMAKMNPSQYKAIRLAMTTSDLALCYGPPGTGKTTVLAHYIYHAVHTQSQKVLVCAPSHVAVDNILEKVIDIDPHLNLIRVGHLARVLPLSLNYTLDDRYFNSVHYDVIRGILNNLKKLSMDIANSKDDEEKKRRISEWKEIKKQLKKAESNIRLQILKSADVVLCTCAGAGHFIFNTLSFDSVVIDEAAQGLDVTALIPLLKSSKKIILAGDHNQLPPTIKSARAIELNLATPTFFERHICQWPGISQMLNVQYRMNDLIMKFSSKMLYDSRLVSHESVKDHHLGHLNTIPKLVTEDEALLLDIECLKTKSIILIDSAGCNHSESGKFNESKCNEGEANTVKTLISRLVQGVGLSYHQIGVISPYAAQVDLIRAKMRDEDKIPPSEMEELEIDTVDSFQGREKECIICTFVRSNTTRKIGFLKCDQRTNVAVTRAKRLLVIVADSETTRSHPFLSELFTYIQENGEVWSAAQFEQDYQNSKPSSMVHKHDSSDLDTQPKHVTKSKKNKKRFAKFIEDQPAQGSDTLTNEVNGDIKQLDQDFSEIIHAENLKKLIDLSKDLSLSPPLAAPNSHLSPFLTLESSINNNSMEQIIPNNESLNAKPIQNGKPTNPKSVKPKNKAVPASKALPKNKALPTSKVAPKNEAIPTNNLLNVQKKDTCHDQRCKQSIKLLDFECQVCAHIFCVAHRMPESHGCGEAMKAARIKEVAQITEELKQKSMANPMISLKKANHTIEEKNKPASMKQRKIAKTKAKRTMYKPKKD